MRRTILVAWAVACLLTAGCRSGPSDAGHGDCGARLVAMWPKPPGQWSYGAGGKGPYPPTWPVLAFVIQQESRNTVGMRSAVLCFAAGPDLKADDPLCCLLAHVRYATPCMGAGPYLIGEWSRDGAEQWSDYAFIFLDFTGGTAGRRVTVFGHGISFDDTGWDAASAYQSHSFSEMFSGSSRYGVYIGDVDFDGVSDLLLPTNEANISGGKAPPQPSQAISWAGLGEVRQVGVFTAEQVADLLRDGRIRLIGPEGQTEKQGLDGAPERRNDSLPLRLDGPLEREGDEEGL